MIELFRSSELLDLVEKVAAGERLNYADGLRLMNSNDLLTIGFMADLVRKRQNGDRVYFIKNRHINHTNVCKNRCRLCAFGVDKDNPQAYLMNLDQIEAKVRECIGSGISELHIVGGLHPDLSFEYFLNLMQRAREILPGVHIQAFTAVEIAYFAETTGLALEEVILKLQEAGLGSIPGGGAEIFAPRVRESICQRKISGEQWLQVHATAHRLGLKTNATMLYGHIETAEERVEHLLTLRRQQDETGGFQAFIPLAFHPENTEMQGTVTTCSTGYDDLKMLAIARLLLDNFPHIKAYWIMIGPKLAQVSLAFGVDDIDGTVTEEKITHAAGAHTAQSLTQDELINLIRAAGRIPVEKDTLYNIIREY